MISNDNDENHKKEKSRIQDIFKINENQKILKEDEKESVNNKRENEDSKIILKNKFQVDEGKNYLNNYAEKKFDYKNFQDSRLSNQSNLRYDFKLNQSKPKIKSEWIKKPISEENKNNCKKEHSNILEKSFNKFIQNNCNDVNEINLIQNNHINENSKTIKDIFLLVDDSIKNTIESDNDVLSVESNFSSKNNNFIKFDNEKITKLSAYEGFLKGIKESKTLKNSNINMKIKNEEKWSDNANFILEYNTFEDDQGSKDFYGIKNTEILKNEKIGTKFCCKNCGFQFKNNTNKNYCAECYMHLQIEINKKYTEKINNNKQTPHVILKINFRDFMN